MSAQFDEVVKIMATLRDEGGCPWDRKQTPQSLAPYLIEEAYEVLETIDAQDDSKLKEELGDVLLQVLFHAQIGRERQTFTIEDVLRTLADKLVRRHPHVFGETTVKDAAEVVHRWEEIKRQEKADNGDEESALDGVPKALPALLRAYQLQVRAARVGFDWRQDESGYAQVVAKVQEELRELDAARSGAARQAGDAGRQRLEEEVGDVLFSLVNLARTLKINPEEALRKADNRFAARFQHMERMAKTDGRTLAEMTLPEKDLLWEQAKAAEREGL
ncbi:MAG: nucleoside triphosphate pyrophosphohydrolase [Nitrospirae bacterium]|nr:MAG: nucleoside triphosphate pyrophosphohydrolase [Nitrospirota bacterium]